MLWHGSQGVVLATMILGCLQQLSEKSDNSLGACHRPRGNAGVHLWGHEVRLLPDDPSGSALLQRRGLHILCRQPHRVVCLVHQIRQKLCDSGSSHRGDKVPRVYDSCAVGRGGGEDLQSRGQYGEVQLFTPSITCLTLQGSRMHSPE